MLLKNPELVKRHEVDAAPPRLRRRGRRARQAEETQTSLGIANERSNETELESGRLAAVGRRRRHRRRRRRLARHHAALERRRRTHRRPTLALGHRAFGGDVAGTDGRGRGSCRRRRRCDPRAALDNPLRMAQLAYDAGMLVEPEEYSAWTLFSRVVKSRARQRGCARRPHEGRRRPRAPRRDGARSRPFRRRARDRRAHSRGAARARGRESARAEDLARRRRRRRRRAPRCRCPSPSAARRARRDGAGAGAPRSRRSTPSSRPAQRSTRRWPKAAC